MSVANRRHSVKSHVPTDRAAPLMRRNGVGYRQANAAASLVLPVALYRAVIG